MTRALKHVPAFDGARHLKKFMAVKPISKPPKAMKASRDKGSCKGKPMKSMKAGPVTSDRVRNHYLIIKSGGIFCKHMTRILRAAMAARLR